MPSGLQVLLVAALTALFFWAFYFSWWQNLTNGVQRPEDERASALVLDPNPSPISQYSYEFHPLVRFTTDAGERIEAESHCSQPVDRGDRVQVFYDPSDPEDVCIAGGTDWSRLSLVQQVTFVAGVLVAGGLVVSLVIVFFQWAEQW